MKLKTYVNECSLPTSWHHGELEVLAVVVLVDGEAAAPVGGGVGEGAQPAPVRPEDADVRVREAAIVREADSEPI